MANLEKIIIRNTRIECFHSIIIKKYVLRKLGGIQIHLGILSFIYILLESVFIKSDDSETVCRREKKEERKITLSVYK